VILDKFTSLAVAAVVLATPAPTLSQKSSQDIVLRNPSNSVHVRIHPCGKSRCGTVVWANDKAKADSARGGTRNLVGTELFREFREVSPKVWKGKVFVPETGTVKDQNTIVARGCLIDAVALDVPARPAPSEPGHSRNVIAEPRLPSAFHGSAQLRSLRSWDSLI